MADNGPFNVNPASMDRSLLYIRLAQAQRMEAEIAKINKKYDGAAAARIENDINKVGEQASEISDWLSRVEAGLKKVNSVREWMLQMKAALSATSPSSAAFDLNYDGLNGNMALQKYDSTSLISNTGNKRGSWREDTRSIGANGMSAEVTHRFLGNDYVIELNDGGILAPDASGALTGVGLNMARDKLQMDSVTGDTVTFTDLTDPLNPTQYTGTIKRGGLGVLPSWLYGDLSVAENKERASADMNAAFKKLARIELDFNIDQAQLSGIKKNLTGKINSMHSDYERVANEEVDAKIAEKKAIKARFDIFMNSLTLTSTRSQNFITQMFQTEAPKKKSLGEVMMNAASGVLS